jgi:hypothetical protein
VVDADSLTVQDTYVTVGPSAEPGAPVILHVQLAGRMCYGQIEARWRALGPWQMLNPEPSHSRPADTQQGKRRLTRH